MNASKVYLAADPVNAEIFKDYLESYGIHAHVREYYLWGGMGDLPANIYPGVWVDDERDHDRARELVTLFEGGGENAPAWQCPSCRERLAGQFDACWRCGTTRPG